MSVPAAPSALELPRAIRDALVQLLLDELASPDFAGAVASARRVLADHVGKDSSTELGGPAAAQAALVALREALADAGPAMAAGGARRDAS
ncbi:hypothetical protein K2Z84_26930, partial [Candidatus Binatia bacterium]|nr:hypothetical protein [Candidatus Binatia bacterium]